MKKKYINILHRNTSIILAAFFMYKGYSKLVSKKLKEVNLDQIISTIIEKASYEAPTSYNIVMNTFKQSGFLDMISIFQIVAGLLIIIPVTRLLGLLLLLPIIFNIFFMHVFFDNRIDENIVTGSLFFVNIILCLYYKKALIKIFLKS